MGGREMRVFNPEKRKHWPVIAAYKDKKISRPQAAAQLKDLGCVQWEIDLYLDNDQTGPEGE
jgi:hypothetical protein